MKPSSQILFINCPIPERKSAKRDVLAAVSSAISTPFIPFAAPDTVGISAYIIIPNNALFPKLSLAKEFLTTSLKLRVLPYWSTPISPNTKFNNPPMEELPNLSASPSLPNTESESFPISPNSLNTDPVAPIPIFKTTILYIFVPKLPQACTAPVKPPPLPPNNLPILANVSLKPWCVYLPICFKFDPKLEKNLPIEPLTILGPNT